MENFNFKKMKELYDNGNHESKECKEYISCCFYPSEDGRYFMYKDNSFIVLDRKTLMDVYLSKFPRTIKDWFLKDYYEIFTGVLKIGHPLIENNEINLCPQLPHKEKPYKTFSTKTKRAVDMMLHHVKTALANDDEASYEYIIKWHSNMVKGNKNLSCLYLRGEEGVGKSTVSDFIRKHVVAEKLSIKSDATPLKGFNKVLFGKLYVSFEELPKFSKWEWEGVSSVLKDLITSSDTLYNQKNEKQFVGANINNFIINSNVEAIQHSEGRRYFIVDVSNRYLGNHDYFDDVYSKCFNDEVGAAFYNYLLEIDTTGFNSQKDMPLNKKKADAIADHLDFTFRFLKENYILRQKDVLSTVSDLFTEYLGYMQSIDKKPLSKIQFNSKLRSININYYKSHGILKFKVSLAELTEIATKKGWLHELDEYDNGKAKKKPSKFDKCVFEEEVDEEKVIDDYKDKEIEALKEKIDELQAIIKEMKKKPVVKAVTKKVVKKAQPKVEDIEEDDDIEFDEQDVDFNINTKEENRIARSKINLNTATDASDDDEVDLNAQNLF